MMNVLCNTDGVGRPATHRWIPGSWSHIRRIVTGKSKRNNEKYHKKLTAPPRGFHAPQEWHRYCSGQWSTANRSQSQAHNVTWHFYRFRVVPRQNFRLLAINKRTLLLKLKALPSHNARFLTSNKVPPNERTHKWRRCFQFRQISLNRCGVDVISAHKPWRLKVTQKVRSRIQTRLHTRRPQTHNNTHSVTATLAWPPPTKELHVNQKSGRN